MTVLNFFLPSLSQENYFYRLHKLSMGVLVLFMLLNKNAFALYPRTYIPAPAGTLLLASYYYHFEGDEYYSNKNKLNIGLKTSTNIGILRPVYFFNWLNKRFVFDIFMMFGKTKFDSGFFSSNNQTSSGLVDPILHGGFVMIDDPGNKFWLGITKYLTIPFGKYDNNQTVNLSENRYKGKTELGLAKGFGKFHLDVTASITIFGSNNDYGINSNKLEQDELWVLETHISRNINDWSYLALGGLWQWGGEGQVNQIEQNDKQNKFALQLTYEQYLSHNHKIGLLFKKELEVDNGFKQNTFSLRYAYIF